MVYTIFQIGLDFRLNSFCMRFYILYEIIKCMYNYAICNKMVYTIFQIGLDFRLNSFCMRFYILYEIINCTTMLFLLNYKNQYNFTAKDPDLDINLFAFIQTQKLIRVCDETRGGK